MYMCMYIHVMYVCMCVCGHHQYCMVCGIQRERRWRGRILRNGRVIVMQQGRRCRFGEDKKRMIDPHNKALK